ncbi:hypothetical protein K7711_06140 [Nocardia sp. CA2R105]|uniref:hypothetical protein n=1 Tax=Nocardia coffeae TaxID=2873381 RepID=UPI001CA6472D|nr:hypothetical protein [Nocardia coffeae]MBY8856051.1 hypothetical protein [Nocardia coffeae]
MSEQNPPAGGASQTQPGRQQSQPSTPTVEPEKRSRIRDIGPTWITAISGLIVALTGVAGVFIGRATVPGTSQPASPPSVTVSAGPATAASAPATSVSVTASAPTVAAGTVLVANCHIVLADQYSLPISRGTQCPFPTKENVTGVDWSGSGILFADDRSTLAELDSSSASYDACKKNTRYVKDISSLAAGDVICYVSKWVVAAITFTKTNNTMAVSPPAEFDVTIWQG